MRSDSCEDVDPAAHIRENCGMQSKCHEGRSTGEDKQGSVISQSKAELKIAQG